MGCFFLKIGVVFGADLAFPQKKKNHKEMDKSGK
jgi:hypothetical protein